MPGDFSVRGAAALVGQYDHDVLLLEDCEGAYKWDNSGTGATYVGTFDASFCYFGSKGMKLRTRSATPAAEDIVTATRPLTYPRRSRLVFRARVNGSDVSAVATFTIQLDIYNGVRHYRCYLAVSPTTPAVYYLSSGGVAVAITNFAFVWTANDWVMLEFAVDLVQFEYLYAWFNGAEKLLTDLAIQNVEASTRRAVTVAISLVAAGAAIAELGLDSLYIGTKDEL